MKPSQKDYAERLTRHHAVILAATKAKQNADLKYVTALTDAIARMVAYYP